MLKIHNLELGMPVWIQEACRYKEGVITEICEIGVRVKTDEKVSPDRIYSQFKIFRRPQDKNKLIADLYDQADLMERAAKQLEDLEI